jgi:hypothetical protein
LVKTGQDHLITIFSATDLTFVLAWSGEEPQARALGEDTLQRSRRTLGADPPLTPSRRPT